MNRPIVITYEDLIELNVRLAEELQAAEDAAHLWRVIAGALICFVAMLAWRRIREAWKAAPQ